MSGGFVQEGRIIDFYFDFISPYSYLAHHRLPDIAHRFGCSIRYRVADLAALKQAAGNTAPRMVEMPLKLAYSREDQRRWASRYGIPIRPPTGSHDSSWLNRGTFFASERGEEAEYVRAVWTRMRRDGLDLAEEATWRRVAADLGWHPDEFVAFIRSEHSARLFAANSRQAHERGVFGVPTMFVRDQMWWGNDRLDFLEEFLSAADAAPATNSVSA